MQDKEFDEVFNSKFEDFEAEPSPMVWNNIDAQLGGNKTKGAIMPWLSIAATIVVLFTAGILFLKKDKAVDKPVKSGKLAVTRVKQSTPVKTDEVVKKGNTVITPTKAVDHIASNKNHHPKNILPINKVVVPVAQPVVNTPVQTQTVNPVDKQLIATVQNPTTAPVKTVVPDNEQPSPKTADVIANTPVERPTVIASAETQETTPVKKRGIHSFGGLINALVAKVDKRQDKIIEFTDTDDDDGESNISGVNLGLVKIKKQ